MINLGGAWNRGSNTKLVDSGAHLKRGQDEGISECGPTFDYQSRQRRRAAEDAGWPAIRQFLPKGVSTAEIRAALSSITIRNRERANGRLRWINILEAAMSVRHAQNISRRFSSGVAVRPSSTRDLRICWRSCDRANKSQKISGFVSGQICQHTFRHQ